MKNHTNTGSNNPFKRAMDILFSRLTQSPDVYPIKFYMKGKRIRRNKFLYLAK